MNQVPNKHWFNFQLGATRRQCMHTTNIFSSDEITCAYLHSSVQARLWELWTETDQLKGVENMYAEGSYSTVTYVKEIKLYLVISRITSSLKQFQQLYFKWRFGMPLISKKKHQKLYFKWRFEMPIISSQFPLKAAICFICNVLGYQFSGNFKKIKKIHLWITLGSWFPYTCTYSLQFFVRSSQRFWYKKLIN